MVDHGAVTLNVNAFEVLLLEGGGGAAENEGSAKGEPELFLSPTQAWPGLPVLK